MPQREAYSVKECAYRVGHLRLACAVNDVNGRTPIAREESPTVSEVEVAIEVPRGSFLKRGSTGQLDFVSPLRCPFDHGSVSSYVGLEDDLLDTVVLGHDYRWAPRSGSRRGEP